MVTITNLHSLSQPFYNNPFSLVGEVLGLLVTLGYYIHSVREYLVSEHALPFPVIVFGAIAALMLVSFVAAISIVTCLGWCQAAATGKPKRE